MDEELVFMMPGKVLIVEDDKLDQRLIDYAFRSLKDGFEYEFADSAEEALQKLSDQAFAPSLILTDLNMPGIGGMELISRLKTSEVHRKTPLIVFSTSSDVSDISDAYERHANSYIVKPDSPSGYSRFAETMKQYWLEESKLPQ